MGLRRQRRHQKPDPAPGRDAGGSIARRCPASRDELPPHAHRTAVIPRLVVHTNRAQQVPKPSPIRFRGPRPAYWHRARLALLSLLAAYLAYCAAVYTLQDRFIFRRSECDAPLPAGHVPAGAGSIWINMGSSQRPVPVEAWYFAPSTSSAPGPAPAVMFFHGTGDLIDGGDPRIGGWRARGFAVLLPEYRGYGRSAGKPSESAIVHDVCRFYDWLASRPEIDQRRIILHGVSLGGGVATQLAARRGAHALILESTFTSVAGFFPAYLAPPILCTSPFRNDRVLPTLTLPILILHGAADDAVPVAQGRCLRDLCPASTYIELPGHHDDFPLPWKPYWSSIDRFMMGAAR